MFLTQGTGYNRGFTLWKLKAYTWFEYLSICAYVVSTNKLTFRNQSASFNCFSIPLGSPWTAIWSHQQAVGCSSSFSLLRCLRSVAATYTTPALIQGSTSPFRKAAETTKEAKATLYSPIKLTHYLLSLENSRRTQPAISRLLMLPSLLDQLSPTQASMHGLPHLASMSRYSSDFFRLRLPRYLNTGIPEL